MSLIIVYGNFGVTVSKILEFNVNINKFLSNLSSLDYSKKIAVTVLVTLVCFFVSFIFFKGTITIGSGFSDAINIGNIAFIGLDALQKSATIVSGIMVALTIFFVLISCNSCGNNERESSKLNIPNKSYDSTEISDSNKNMKIDQSDSFRYPAGDEISPIKKPKKDNIREDHDLSYNDDFLTECSQ